MIRDQEDQVAGTRPVHDSTKALPGTPERITRQPWERPGKLLKNPRGLWRLRTIHQLNSKSSGCASSGARVDPAMATTRKKNEMLTALPRRSTMRGHRRKKRDATSGTPIRRTVCTTSSSNGAACFVKTKVIAGTSPRPRTYRSARETRDRRVSPWRIEVIGTTAIAAFAVFWFFERVMGRSWWGGMLG